MFKIYMLARANVAKMKVQGVILVLLLLISALMLNVGLMLAVNFASFMDELTTELATSDAFYALPYAQVTPEVIAHIEAHEQVLSVAVYDAVIVPAEVSDWREGSTTGIIFRNKEIVPSVSRWMLVSEVLGGVDNAVFVPYGLSTGAGFRLGDRIEMRVGDTPLVFTIAGFTEDILFSNTADVQFAFYVSGALYSSLLERFEPYHAALVFVDLQGETRNVEMLMHTVFLEGVAPDDDASMSNVAFMAGTYEMLVGGRVLLPMTLSMMVIVFAFIIVLVCLTMIRFRINNSIEEDMPAIGSLKAAGFSSWQIRSGLWAQYAMISLPGALLGIPLTYAVLPFIRRVIAMQTGLAWQQGLDVGLDIATLLIILAIVSVLVLVCSRKIKRIDPVVALRGGVSGHSFKRNHLPLDSVPLSLNTALGSKTMLQNLAQSGALLLIFVLIAFTASFFVALRHMATDQRDAYMALTGVELPDVVVEFRPDAPSHEVRSVMADMDGVWQAVFLDSTNVVIAGEYITAYVMDNFAQKVNPSVYMGRYPIHPNEVAISGFAAQLWGVGVDDMLSIGPVGTPFVVTGLTQGQGATGHIEFVSVSLTTAGVAYVSEGFEQLRLGIYLQGGADVGAFVSQLSTEFDGYLLSVLNLRDIFIEGNTVITDILVLLSSTMLGFAVVVILLVLYFITGAVIVRRHRYLGIQKAMGYTTLDLMRQVSISFVPPLVLGVVVGAVSLAVTFNAIAALVMRPLGVLQASFDIPHLWIAVTGVVLAVISYATIVVITGRIRRISAYDLLR